MTQLTGTGALLVLLLRARWRSILLTGVLAGVLVGALAATQAELYPTPMDRTAYAASMGASPAVEAFNGRGYDLTTLGGITSFEVGFMGLLVFSAVPLLIAIRATRGDEDAGRTELLRAQPIGLAAPAAAAVLVSVILGLLCGLASYAGLLLAGLPAAGSLWYGGSVAAYAIFFGLVGLLSAQIGRDGRTASLIGLGVVVLTFVVRAVIDGRGLAATWLSPMGWFAEVRPWGDDQRAWPLMAFGAGSTVFAAVSVLLAVRRDVGAGLIGERPGPPRGPRWLGTPAGIAWRLSRPLVIGWTVGMTVWTVAFGMLTQEVDDIAAANPAILDALGLEHGYQLVTVLAGLLASIGSAAAGVAVVGRLAAEEQAGRTALALSSPVSRATTWTAWAVVAGTTVLVVNTVSSLGLGLSSWLSTGEGSAVSSALGGALPTTVAALSVTAVSLLGAAIDPPLHHVGWVLVGWSAAVLFLGEALDMPTWLRETSAFRMIGEQPAVEADGSAVLLLGVSAALLAVAATYIFTRRNLRAG